MAKSILQEMTLEQLRQRVIANRLRGIAVSRELQDEIERRTEEEAYKSDITVFDNLVELEAQAIRYDWNNVTLDRTLFDSIMAELRAMKAVR